MTIAGIPLIELLPPPNGSRILLLGGGNDVARKLRRAGYRVDRHALDTGPMAERAEYRSRFKPPVVEWPQPEASYDAIVLLDWKEALRRVDTDTGSSSSPSAFRSSA